MRIVVEGGKALLNPYSVILPAGAGHGPEGREPARRLAAWLASPEGQAAIGGFTLAGQRLFNPVSVPKPE